LVYIVAILDFQISEHDVIESHPDNVLEDLRLDRPFQTLVEFMDTQKLEAMNKQVSESSCFIPWTSNVSL